MRTFLPLLFILISTSHALANPPDEDILRPRLPSRGRFFIGADAGVNVTWFDGNPIYRAFFPSEEESRMFRSAFGAEPFGSFYAGMSLTNAIRVRVRADYDVRTADRTGRTIDSCELVDAVTGRPIGSVPVEVEKSYSLAITYLTFSLLGEYSLGNLFFFGGPSWSMPLERTFSETDRIVDASSICIYFENSPDTTRQIEARVEGIDNVSSVVAVKLGVGYEIPMSENLMLVPQLGFDVPFSTALEDEEPFEFRRAGSTSGRANTTRLNHNVYFRVFQASIGLRFSF